MTRRTILGRSALAAGVAALLLGSVTHAFAAQASGRPEPKATSVAGPLGNLVLREKQVPVSQMPAAVKAAAEAGHLTVRPNTSTSVVELVSQAYGKCVDANTGGATAGQNGDVVQLWDCYNDSTNNPNQWWWAAQTDHGWTELINWQYGLCLDADNGQGFVNGAKVQLWQCYFNSITNPNQWWDFGPHGQYTGLPIMWGTGKVLDVNDVGPSAGQNGDKIQIWDFLSGSNQYWLQ
jgi:hypothetical protein